MQSLCHLGHAESPWRSMRSLSQLVKSAIVVLLQHSLRLCEATSCLTWSQTCSECRSCCFTHACLSVIAACIWVTGCQCQPGNSPTVPTTSASLHHIHMRKSHYYVLALEETTPQQANHKACVLAHCTQQHECVRHVLLCSSSKNANTGQLLPTCLQQL